ncbi:MAG: hypothetical protein QM780_16955 [Hyphomicrobium sp.]|uniref:hypothetical protein n=1 Tax=Hyphomicrobium sp. TaxID=82 RepID=UPI0039E670F9
MKAQSKYRTLNPGLIVSSLNQLVRRIQERFPGAGLASVCRDLVELANETAVRAEEINRPHFLLRFIIWIAITAGLVLLIAVAQIILSGTRTNDDLFGTLQGIDSGFNIVVLMGATLFFVSSIETRWKQRRALNALHEFRSIIHVIDMHQLTKDPSMLAAVHTSSSPDRSLSPFELVRYLDYCSEMLSLTAKLAALYAEKLSDPVVVDTVGDIERLTSDLSGKIWQKITIVQSLEGRDVPLPSIEQIYRTPSV